MRGLSLSTNLLEGLGSLVGFLRNPFGPSKVDNIHEHELESAGELGKVNHSLDALEVSIHHRTTLFGLVEVATNGPEQLAERLNFGLVRHSLIVDELMHTFVHDTFSKHAELVELADKLDKTKTTALGGRRCVVLVREQSCFGSLLALIFLFRLLGEINGPTTLKLLLTSVEEVLAEKVATTHYLAILVLDTLVTNLGAHSLEHTLTELGIHGSPMRLIRGLLEGKLNNLSESTAVCLLLRLRSNEQDLICDSVEFLGGHLVQGSLDLSLNHIRFHMTTRGCSS